MTAPSDDERRAEIVPLHALPDAPDTFEPDTPGGESADATPPVYADLTRVAGDRLPIIPPQFRGKENIRAALVLAIAQTSHRTRYHGLRTPVYLLAVAAWAIVGVFRVIRRQIIWWWVLEQHTLRSGAVIAGDSREWKSLHKVAQETRKVRGYVLLAEVALILAGSAALALYAPWWAWIAAAVVPVILLARAGHPGKLIKPAIIPPQYQRPTHEIITRALGSLGIPEINRVVKEGGPGIAFITDVMRDGPGWNCHLDLPLGVTATDILRCRESLASGLRRPLSATWPAGVPAEHAGRLELWVGFNDISKTKPPAWPLLKARETDVFGPVPFGYDPRGRLVNAPLFEVNWLIGASPGQGKTGVVRGLACAVALDVLAEMWIHELAGKGDIEPMAQASHRYCSGLDDDSIGYAGESLRLLRRELDRRSAQLKQIPKEFRPEGKVTRELAARKALRLHPLVAFFDEVQNLFMHPEHGKQAQEDAGYVIRLGRAYGVILVLATQRPDKESVPTAVTGNIGCRFCLQVPGQMENDLVLGTSAYKNGYNAAAFRPRVDAGLGWLKADGPAQIVRTFKVDLPEAETIAKRARGMRQAAGRLSGYALGEGDDGPVRDVLADVLTVLGTRTGLHWGDLADELANTFADRWADVTGEALSAQCRGLGVPSVDVKVAGVTLKGCRKIAVERAVGR